MNAAGMVGVLSIVMLFSIIGILCCSFAIVHHGKRLQLGLQLRHMLNDAGKNPVTEVRRLAFKQLMHVLYSMTRGCDRLYTSPGVMSTASHFNLLALPLTALLLVLVSVLEFTVGMAASLGQYSAVRAAAAFHGAERGNGYLGCSALLYTMLSAVGFAIASPVQILGLAGVYSGSFLPRWVGVTKHGNRRGPNDEVLAPLSAPRSAIAPLAINALQEVPMAALPRPTHTSEAHVEEQPRRLRSARNIAWDTSPADGTAPAAVPGPAPPSTVSSNAEGAAITQPLGPAFADIDTSTRESLEGSERQDIHRMATRRLSRRSSRSLMQWSTEVAGLSLVHRSRMQVLQRAWAITRMQPRARPDWMLVELADHIEEWHALPRAQHSCTPHVAFVQEMQSRVSQYFAVVQLCGSPAEAGAAIIASLPLFLIEAACLTVLVPFVTVAACAPMCFPFLENTDTLLLRGQVWLQMMLMPWVCLAALAHGYARLAEGGEVLLLRWIVLLSWICADTVMLGLSRRTGVTFRWYLGVQWVTALCGASIVAAQIMTEVDLAANLGASGAVALVASVINVVVVTYITLGALYLVSSRQGSIGDVLPLAAQPLPADATLGAAGERLAVMRKDSSLGPAGTIVELRGSSVTAPATGQTMDMVRFLASEHAVIRALPPHFPLLQFIKGDRIAVYDEVDGWYFGRDALGQYGWFPGILGGKRRTFQSNARIFRGRIARRLRAAWRSLRWTFTLYRPSDIQRSLAEDTPLQFRCKALTAWILLLLANSLIVAMIFTGYLVMHDSTRRVTLIMLAAAAFSCLSMVVSSAMGMCHQMKLIRVVDADEEGGEDCHQDRPNAGAQATVVLPVWDDEEDLEPATTVAEHDDEDEAMFTEEAFPSGAGLELEESYSSLPGSVV